MLLMHYMANGESGRCRRGCCSPDRVWDSDLAFTEVESEEAAISASVDYAFERGCDGDYQHFLLRPATAAEAEYYTYNHCLDDSLWDFCGGLARLSIHEMVGYEQGLRARRLAAEEAHKEAQAAAQAQVRAQDAERLAREERANYERLKAKYEPATVKEQGR